MAVRNIQETVDNVTSKITKEDKQNTDILVMTLPIDFSIEVGDTVNYSDNIGTLIFSGLVQTIKSGTSLEVEVYDHGAELLQRVVNEIFNTKKPEEIIEDVITNYTTLTYVSTITSSTALNTYVANKKRAWDVVTEMSELLLANFRVDKNKNFQLELEGGNVSSKSISDANAVLSGAWLEDKTNLVNSCTVIGDERQVFQKTENFAGPTTQVTLTEIPISVRVTVGGTEKIGYVPGQSTGDYFIDRENKQINFDVSSSTIVVEYNYSIPINVRRRNKSSIDMYGPHDKTYKKPYIKTRDEAKAECNFLLNRFKDPLLSSTWESTLIADFQDFESYKPNEVINVSDNIRSIFGDFIIRKVVRESIGSLKISVGEPDDDFVSWSKESQQRIKQLEERDDNSTILNEDELVTEALKLTFTTSVVEIKSIGKADAWVLDDPVNSQIDKTFKLDGGGEVILYP